MIQNNGIPSSLSTPITPGADSAASDVQNRRDTPIRQINADLPMGADPDKATGDSRLPRDLQRPDLAPRNMDTHIAGAMNALNRLSGSAEADIFALMALFQEIAQEQRNAARTERMASMDAQINALHSAADKIKEAAEARFKGALAQGIAQIVGGALSVGSGVVSGVAGFKSASSTLSGHKAGQAAVNSAPEGASGKTLARLYDHAAAPGNAAAARAGAVAQTAGPVGQGLSGVANAAGSMVQAGYERDAAEADADRARLEADAKKLEAGTQEANEIMQQMMQIMQDVRDKLGAIQQSHSETARGIARNI